MSAQYDRSQRIAFVYSNLYHVYRKGLNAATEGSSSATEDLARPFALVKGHESGKVLKAGTVEVKAFTPPALEKSEAKSEQRRKGEESSKNPAIQNMKANISHLNELQGKLRFLLTELEDLVGSKKKND